MGVANVKEESKIASDNSFDAISSVAKRKNEKNKYNGNRFFVFIYALQKLEI